MSTQQMVVVGDDCALEPGTSIAGRRGLAGTVLVHKVAGAAAEAGLSVSEVAAECRAAASRVGTMGVALSTCALPGEGPIPAPTPPSPVSRARARHRSCCSRAHQPRMDLHQPPVAAALCRMHCSCTPRAHGNRDGPGYSRRARCCGAGRKCCSGAVEASHHNACDMLVPLA